MEQGDLNNILAAVHKYPGGASEVNKRIKDQMRSWLAEAAKPVMWWCRARRHGPTTHPSVVPRMRRKLLCDVAPTVPSARKTIEIICHDARGMLSRTGAVTRKEVDAHSANITWSPQRNGPAVTLRLLPILCHRVGGFFFAPTCGFAGGGEAATATATSFAGCTITGGSSIGGSSMGSAAAPLRAVARVRAQLIACKGLKRAAQVGAGRGPAGGLNQWGELESKNTPFLRPTVFLPRRLPLVG